MLDLLEAAGTIKISGGCGGDDVPVLLMPNFVNNILVAVSSSRPR